VRNARRSVAFSRQLTMLTLIVVALLLLFCRTPARAQRTYWVRSVDSLATGRVPHTHVETTGYVTLVSKESDGDIHIRLTALSGRFIICECVPELPCAVVPKVGDTVRVKGIYRRDPEHGWWEIHPVEVLEIAQP
jgi:hypothetical protein